MAAKREALNLEFPLHDHNGCRALTELTIEQLPRDGSLGKLREFPGKAEIWQPDDLSDRIYFLQSGTVEIVCCDSDGRETNLAMIETGQAFGELCFCRGETRYRRTTARATENKSAMLEIKIADFLQHLQTNSQMLGNMLFTFCLKLGHSERRVEILSQRTVEERVATALLYLAEFRGSHEGNGAKEEQSSQTKLKVTHDELAGLTATSRQRVTLTLNRFRELGLVSYERNQPLLINKSALARRFV